MARWSDVEAADAPFAREVRARFDAHRHKTLATLRKDASPRISGIEATFYDGDLWLGMMPGSLKARDLRRDPRFALHSASVDPPEGDESSWAGDAKVAGRAVPVEDASERARILAVMGGGGQDPAAVPVFRLDLSEAVLVRVGDPADHLLIEIWREGEGLRRVRRA